MRLRRFFPLLFCFSCVQNETSDIRFFPDKTEFIEGGVSEMMESRCAGLDCHGQTGRPLRLYSATGLRLQAAPDGKLRDDRPTTPEERNENYQSVIGLEPEAVSDCVRTRGQYVDFQLLLKPLDDSGRGIRHKGGPVLRASANDPGWNCLFGWLAGDPNRQACKDATF
jgi:hypothetical protein